MATTNINAQLLSVSKPVELAVRESCEQSTTSEEQCAPRWRAPDRLLRVSFGSISPAYLFDSYPPNR